MGFKIQIFISNTNEFENYQSKGRFLQENAP